MRYCRFSSNGDKQMDAISNDTVNDVKVWIVNDSISSDRDDWMEVCPPIMTDGEDVFEALGGGFNDAEIFEGLWKTNA
ncbi:hypothetical protein QVD17_20402 [Tagetes erecta]|uniref:Uncharacterized protein n=1 Tax=Tagetes erecta TaxID=13708 RepID=A0AAD8NY45_TARER|nr:hypothetical protein QVD17_20402 [Tagetes erecta]